MSILCIGLDGPLGEAVLARLVAQQDQVRVIENDATRAARWRALGAHVARGALDPDLIERAAQNARTLVLFEDGPGLPPTAIDALLEGGRAAGVGRVVVVGADPRSIARRLSPEGLDYVAIATGGRVRRLVARRARPTHALVAAAVDAADDLAGHPELEVDLTRPAGRAALGLDAEEPKRRA